MMEFLLDRWKAVAWQLPEDFLSYDHYCRVVKNLDWNSSPGLPWMRQSATNRILFEVIDGVPSELALMRVWEVVRKRLEDRDCDPIRLFIKPEPLKRRKLEQGSYRLISSVSVVDQIIDGMLFGTMNDLVIENYLQTPSKVGWSPYNGGWKIMPVFGMKSLDKRAWDWSMQAWVVEFLFELRKSLMIKTRHSKLWEDLALWRYRMLFESPLFMTSGGLLLRQLLAGVMKSGCFNTIIDNSMAQDFLHVRVCLELGLEVGDLMSMGDDTTQRKFKLFSEYVDRLSQYCHVKEVVDANEFAGHRFRLCYVEPLYRGKHAFNLLHMDPRYEDDMALSYSLLYHRSACRDYIRNLFEDMGLYVPSLRTLDVIYDGE
ncbi:putative RdRP [Myrmica rubra virus 7]|nr:putative RdRP [Myrmica rubra virus 7]